MIHNITSTPYPPLPVKVLAQLRADATDPHAAAKRKGVTMDDWEYFEEKTAAQTQFALGCWLHLYVPLIRREGIIGHKARVECMLRLFLAGEWRPGYKFFTVFGFGEREFDTLVEMGDADEVIDAVRHHIPLDPTGRLIEAFQYMGWPLLSPQIAAGQQDLFAACVA